MNQNQFGVSHGFAFSAKKNDCRYCGMGNGLAGADNSGLEQAKFLSSTPSVQTVLAQTLLVYPESRRGAHLE